MPKYHYFCKNCNEEFYVYHSINDLLENCDRCFSSGSLERIPSFISGYKFIEKRKVAGNIVKEYIEDTKEEVRREKERKRKDY